MQPAEASIGVGVLRLFLGACLGFGFAPFLVVIFFLGFIYMFIAVAYNKRVINFPFLLD